MKVGPAKKKNQAIKTKQLQQMNEIWPETPLSALWSRSKVKGFATIPKTLPLVMRLIDLLTKGQPASATYFALWANTWDISMVEITREGIMAWESGFFGPRAVSTWRGRMHSLKRLGFIDNFDGPDGPFTRVLIHNPHAVIRFIKETKTEEFCANQGDFIKLYTELIDKCARLKGGDEFDPKNEAWKFFQKE
ncbi:MAG: hypothetical protein BA863_14730 [Desulfovibrio sp. S3730MH75]|nr:MAG: hypothetical protein BA863_14730 [Desulfovibrio sp. S3730MH75]